MLEIASILLNLNLSNAPNLDSHRHMFLPVRIAHEVKTSQEVGGTIHIEPNDRPIAGQKNTHLDSSYKTGW